MICKCNLLNSIEKNGIEIFIERYLTERKVDGYRWKTLYQCKFCNAFWEMKYTDDRFGGIPSLMKVTNEYVANNWGSEFIPEDEMPIKK